MNCCIYPFIYSSDVKEQEDLWCHLFKCYNSFHCRGEWGVSCWRATRGPEGQFNRSCTRMHHYLSMWDCWEHWWPVTSCFMPVWKQELLVSFIYTMRNETRNNGRCIFVKLVFCFSVYCEKIAKTQESMILLESYEKAKKKKAACDFQACGPTEDVNAFWNYSTCYRACTSCAALSVYSRLLSSVLCGYTHVNWHQLLIYAWNTSHIGKLCSYVLHPSDSLLFLPLCIRLSLRPSTSRRRCLLSGAATTCLGFDVSVCIVTEAMPPPTSNPRCVFWSALIPCRSQPKRQKESINSYFWCMLVSAACKLQSAGVVMWSMDGAEREGRGWQDGGRAGGGTGGREKRAPCMIYWSGITELFPTEKRGRWRDKLSRDSFLRGKG